MLTHIRGNILTVAPLGAVIFQQVNCKGVMGSGLAKQIVGQWPEIKVRYSSICSRSGSANLGKFFAWDVAEDVETLPAYQWRTIVNLFGQDNYGRSGKRYTNYTALTHALKSAARYYATRPCYFPHGLGCGLGGGKWEFVQELIEENFPDAVIVQL